MTTTAPARPAPFRIARIRPLNSSEQFFVTNPAQDFGGDAGSVWEIIESPFPGSPANQNSPERAGWTLGSRVAETDFTFLAPCSPANVFGMAHNTGAPGRALPAQAFHKASTSVVGPHEPILLSPDVGYVDPEAELTVVVGRTSRNLTLATARAAVLGFTIGNDVSARDLQKSDELWISAKSQDTFTPLGPWIVINFDDDDAAISIVHNGTELAAASTRDLGWGVDEILIYLSSFMTLHPGDVILTGFPAECRQLRPGDTVTCRIAGLGDLTNPVRATPVV
ncbi:fumarylacetoacetate hydrolase family protein [Paeniglutamicibacter antarcticus]|uniref:Fumarylacetoacetate hydrolase family protein n=1 Tax=Arthrobacter terrae TaxID=2935737 RepID=A0A931CNH3_9MICC|nr:fumarylacetoacetate hydrolase family protein [Arthrobacter terrae]MBG0741468.1 fumarylacetoacetate hydrolase family protein [Arthrobacter terrae]